MGNLPDLSTLIPSAGVLGLLAWLIVHIMRQSTRDRAAYAANLQALHVQHAGDIKDLVDRHNNQIEDLQEQVKVLRGDVAQLRSELESERRTRWAAEDAAARYRRMIGDTNGPA